MRGTFTGITEREVQFLVRVLRQTLFEAFADNVSQYFVAASLTVSLESGMVLQVYAGVGAAGTANSAVNIGDMAIGPLPWQLSDGELRELAHEIVPPRASEPLGVYLFDPRETRCIAGTPA